MTTTKLSAGDKETARLKGLMSPGKPRAHVTEVADEVFANRLPADQIIEIPIDLIVPSPYQVRSMADKEYIDQLAQSIQANGMVAPVIVRQLLPGNNPDAEAENQVLPSNKFELVAGHHRLEAARTLGLSAVRAVVRDMSNTAAAMALTVDNAVRKNLSDYDRYKHIGMLRELGLCKTQADLAIALGVAQPTISNLDAFGDLPPEAVAYLETNPAAVGSKFVAAVKAACKSHPDVVAEAIRRLVVVDTTFTAKDALRWIAEKTTRPVRGVEPEEYKVGGLRLVLRTGKVELSGPGLDTAAVEKLIRAHWQELVKP